jgi:hypothetical protein
MAFRVKDLMISVLNKPEGLLECARGTVDPRIIALTPAFTPRLCNMWTWVVPCPGNSIIPCGGVSCGASDDPIYRLTDYIRTDEELAVLKERLKQRLQEVEELERVRAAEMRPKTLEEVQALKGQVAAAMDELNTMEEELQKKAAAAPK